LKPDIRKLFKRDILGSLGGVIAALPDASFAACANNSRNIVPPARAT
jgi:hypothetical protein